MEGEVSRPTPTGSRIGRIHLSAVVRASPERCFDLARSVDVHQASAASTRERAVAGVTHGLMGPGDTVTWEARHFGITWRLTSKIVEFDPPTRFVDEMQRGPFRRWRHEHLFRPGPDGTTLEDLVEYALPLGALGQVVDAALVHRHLVRFLRSRNQVIKRLAEGAA